MPTVIDLRGSIEGPLGRVGASIGSIISSIKGPDAADRKAFFKRIQDNPELLNTFGKITRDNPGVLQGMFPFLRDEDIEGFQGVLPTLEDLREATERPGLTPETAGGQLTPETATALGEAARAQTVGMTPSGLAIEPKRVAAAEAIPQEAVTAGLRREVTGLTPGQTAQDAWNTEIFNAAMDSFNALGMEEADVAALRDKLPSAFFDPDNKRMFEQRKTLAQMQIDAANIDRARERLEASERSIGARWTERTKVGTPETWQMFLFTQEMNDRAKGLAEETILPQNQTDIRLMEVARAFARADQVEKSVEEAAVQTQISAIIGNVGKLDPFGNLLNPRSVRQVWTEEINRRFLEIHLLTDGRVPLRIAEIEKHTFKNDRLVIKDEFGNEIDVGQNVEGFQAGQGSAFEPQGDEGAAGGGEIGLLNFETVDISSLPEKTRGNLVAIMTGEGTFEQLQAFDPASAQLILDARRNR